MKKIWLIATLLGSTSFVSMANTPLQAKTSGAKPAETVRPVAVKKPSDFGCTTVCLSCDVAVGICGNTVGDMISLASVFEQVYCG